MNTKAINFLPILPSYYDLVAFPFVWQQNDQTIANETQRKTQMPALTQLKLAQYVRPAAVSPIQQRRLKLIRRLREQMQLASAVESGTPHTATRLRTVVDPETGVKQSVVVPKRVKSWWSSAESGRVILTVRYGSKLLEFSKGKAAIEVASMQQLVPTLQVLCDAVSSGELDAQLEIASNKLKAGFGR